MNDLLTKNYNEIINVAKRITNRHHKELINETFLDVYKFSHPAENEQYIKWFSKCMANRAKWTKSSFNKSIKIYSNNILTDIEEKKEHDKINLNEIKTCLEMHEIELYKLHFDMRLSAREIASLLEKENGTKESYQSYQRLINIMKQKIKSCIQSTL